MLLINTSSGLESFPKDLMEPCSLLPMKGGKAGFHVVHWGYGFLQFWFLKEDSSEISDLCSCFLG